MENMEQTTPRQPSRRRKKRKSWKRMVRAYLPLAAVVLVIILFIIFAVGSVNRANERREQERLESLAVESSIAQQQADWELEALQLVAESEQYAVSCDWDKAIEVLDRFSGNPADFATIMSARQAYENGDSNLVSWEDPKTIPFLSFGKLIMDPITGFSGNNGENNRYLYISCAEFTAILQQLYDNGYMLVDMDDIFTTTTAEDGSALIVKNDLRLPAGKKPIVLIHAQTGGYENKLVSDENGNIRSLVTPESGEPYTGSYDFVPLLEDFIASHPGFSLKGARAILAVTAGKNIFGYELDNVDSITACANDLKELGYTLASGTYGNIAYGKVDLLTMQEDIANWETIVEPLLGETEILAYAKSSDVDDGKASYGSNKKYQKLYGAGFKYYLGTCYNSTPWMDITDNTIRMGRITVNGSNLKEKASLYAALFDATKVYGAK